MDKNPYIPKAIKALGGPVAAARLLEIPNYQTVQQWVRNENIPAEYAKSVEDKTGISRRFLCRQWPTIWPELGDLPIPVESVCSPGVSHA